METPRSCRSRFSLATAAMLLTSLLGCGSSSEDICQKLVDRVCEKANECTAPASSREDICMGAAHGTTCYQGAACKTAFARDLCNDTTKTEALFSTCYADFSQTVCAGSQEKYAQMPDSCTEILECNSGPCLE